MLYRYSTKRLSEDASAPALTVVYNDINGYAVLAQDGGYLVVDPNEDQAISTDGADRADVDQAIDNEDYTLDNPVDAIALAATVDVAGSKPAADEPAGEELVGESVIRVTSPQEWRRICESRGAKVKGNRAYRKESLVGVFRSGSGVYDPNGGLEPKSNAMLRRALKQAESALQRAYRAIKESSATPDPLTKTGMPDTSGRVDDGVDKFVNQDPDQVPKDTLTDKAANFTLPSMQGTDKGPYPSDKGKTVSNTPGQTKESTKPSTGLVEDEDAVDIPKSEFKIYRTPEGKYTIFSATSNQYVDSGGYYVDNSEAAQFDTIEDAQRVYGLL